MSNARDQEYCPCCGSSRAVKNGATRGKQVYLCRGCKKQWRTGPAVGKHRFPPEQIGAAIRMYYSGWSFRRTAKCLMAEFDIRDTDVAPQTIRYWVRKYTAAAKGMLRERKATGGGRWWLCRQPTHLHQRVWWIVLDDATGYVLGSQIGSSDSDDAAVGAILEVLYSTVLTGYELVYTTAGTDSHRSRLSNGPDAILQVIKDHLPVKTVIRYAGSKDAPLPSETVNNVLNEYVNTGQRFARIRSDAEFQRYIDGWALNRNLFTGQADLAGRTPASAAGISMPFTDWADVVKQEAKTFIPGSDP